MILIEAVVDSEDYSWTQFIRTGFAGCLSSCQISLATALVSLQCQEEELKNQL